MCWSGEASAVLATIGLGSTVYMAVKKEKKELWVPLGYFTLMELLQAVTYSYIDQCDNPVNQVLTLLGFIHISFQPLFINMVSMYFIPERIRKKISWFVYGLCFFGYTFPGFILPMVYGSWRMSLYHALVGPGLAYLLTDNPNEWPAVWCLFSIALLLAVIKTPLRKILHVTNLYFWRYPFIDKIK